MKDLIKDIVVAMAIVLIITAVIKPTIVKETSMEPTFHENNFLIVNKLSYMINKTPDYEDVIIFKTELENNNGTGKKMLIKRVIGVEDDVITIEDGVVYRNGEKLDEPYTMDGYTTGEIRNYVVPKNGVFVMGDNRAVSLDSRAPEIGSITEKSIVGKAFIRIYPFNEITLL